MTELHKELSEHRFKQALSAIQSAKFLIERHDYEGAANRTYYAVFHALRSVLALDKVDFRKHSGVISYFRKTYVKTNTFPNEVSKTIGKAFELRSEGDYDDYYEVSEKEITELVDRTEKMLYMIEEYLKSRIQ